LALRHSAATADPSSSGCPRCWQIADRTRISPTSSRDDERLTDNRDREVVAGVGRLIDVPDAKPLPIEDRPPLEAPEILAGIGLGGKYFGGLKRIGDAVGTPQYPFCRREGPSVRKFLRQ
jgi:hypothetical protein